MPTKCVLSRILNSPEVLGNVEYPFIIRLVDSGPDWLNLLGSYLNAKRNFSGSLSF